MICKEIFVNFVTLVRCGYNIWINVSLYVVSLAVSQYVFLCQQTL